VRLKRRLLSEVVEENLAEIRNLPRRRRRRAAAGWSWLAAALLPLVLVAGSHGVTAPAVGSRADDPAAAAGSPPAAAGSAAGATAAPRTPGPLDPLDPAVFPLGIERVVIDPGHGGRNGGTTTPSGLVEKDLTLDIALRLAALLDEAGFEAVLTRRDDVEMSLEERAALANRESADLFVSIHVNWIENRGVRGVETYFLGTTDDPFVNRLAAAENRGSGYSQADLRALLDELYASLRQSSSERLAAALQRSLLRSLRTVNPEVEDRGVKSAPFIVLMETDMPAVLAEVSCLSNQEEAELLARPLYRQYIAEALLAGIRGYAAGGRAPDDTADVKAAVKADVKGTRS
jgi:N-acetylmuramoyl-L-alanine amidase